MGAFQPSSFAELLRVQPESQVWSERPRWPHCHPLPLEGTSAPPRRPRRQVCSERSLVLSLVALLVTQTWHSALSPKGPRPSRLRPPPRNKGEDEVVNEAATRVRRTPVWSECPLLGTGLTFLQGPPSPPLQSSDPREHVAAPGGHTHLSAAQTRRLLTHEVRGTGGLPHTRQLHLCLQAPAPAGVGGHRGLTSALG